MERFHLRPERPELQRRVIDYVARDAAQLLQRARKRLDGVRRPRAAATEHEQALVRRFMAAWDAVDIEGLVALFTEEAAMTMPPERMRIAGAYAIGEFFASVPLDGRLDKIRLVPTATNRQPALAAYAPAENGEHRPYGLMVLEVDGKSISGILGFPDPWLFEQCGVPAALKG